MMNWPELISPRAVIALLAMIGLAITLVYLAMGIGEYVKRWRPNPSLHCPCCWTTLSPADERCPFCGKCRSP